MAGAVLLAHDKSLEPPCLDLLRPVDAAPLNPARHGVNRATRLRWLAGGADASRQWDAFLAQAAAPLPAPRQNSEAHGARHG